MKYQAGFFLCGSLRVYALISENAETDDGYGRQMADGRWQTAENYNK